MRALAVVVLCAAAPAWAQSKRYPPVPVDRDAEAAAKSDLWDAAILPEQHAYQDLLSAASAALARRGTDDLADAIKKLDQAVRLLPKEAMAYRLRGDAQLERRDWAQCAADFAAADANARREDEPARATAELRRKLGICQARAGKLAEAERTLAETAASGNAAPEVWMRLGEVRIAMGKLDEAIAALRSALDTTDAASQAMIHFLLASAYDRARRSGDALDEAAEGLKLDRQLAILHNPVVPALGVGELDYLLGVAYSAEVPAERNVPQVPPRPEHALFHFRSFVAAAPDSPWRRRAEDHIRELRAIDLPDTLTRNGTAQPDFEATRAVIRRGMPQMRACLAKLPPAVVEVEVLRAGPRTPVTDRQRPRYFSPPDGTNVRRSDGELSDAELTAAERCLLPLVARLGMPAVRERDTYYKVLFYVVAP